MSGFDDNPFADPFADPAVRSATQSSQPGLEEYNPFEQQTAAAGGPAAPAAAGVAQPAVMSPTPEVKPPAYTSSGQQQISTAEFQRRQEELERKADDLARREEALRNGEQLNARQNNWPPLPSFVPLGPCFYQDINVDIPLDFQRLVRNLYYIWCLHSLMLFINVIGGMSALIQMGEFSLFGLSILYFILFTPAAYVCWFRPAYKAFRSDSSMNFMVFFFVFFFQLMGSVIQAIGVPGLGACGLVNGVGAIHKGGAGNVFVGVLMVIIGLGFSVIALLDLYLITKVHRIYRHSTASFSKAQQEFTSGVMHSETVQSATADLAANAVRSQMASSDMRY